MIKDKVLVRCVVNGKEVAEYVDPRESLLDMLRNRLGLTSVKKGWEKISVPWKVWKRTGILPVFRRLLLRREQSSAVFAHRALLCLQRCFWSGARYLQEKLSKNTCQVICAAAPDTRIL